jgi:hypothetical protein
MYSLHATQTRLYNHYNTHRRHGRGRVIERIISSACMCARIVVVSPCVCVHVIVGCVRVRCRCLCVHARCCHLPLCASLCLCVRVVVFCACACTRRVDNDALSVCACVHSVDDASHANDLCVRARCQVVDNASSACVTRRVPGSRGECLVFALVFWKGVDHDPV